MEDLSCRDLSTSAQVAGSFLGLLLSIEGCARSVGFHNTSMDTLDYSLLSSDIISSSKKSFDTSETRLGKAELLRNSILQSQYLLSLSLMNNSLGEKRGVTLINGIATSSTLVSLSIVMNGLGKKSAAAIAETLRTNHSLTYLDLSYNPFGVKGGQFIAQALGGLRSNKEAKGDGGSYNPNISLAELVLVETRIGDKGGRMMLAAMENGCGLTTLALGGNGIHPKTLKQIEVMVKSNQTKVLRVMEDCGDNESVAWKRASCMVVGNGRVGKSSLIRALTDQAFVPDLHSTKGVVLNALVAKAGAPWFFATDKEYTSDMIHRLVNTKLKLSARSRLDKGPRGPDKKSKQQQSGEQYKGEVAVLVRKGSGLKEEKGRKHSLSGLIQSRLREGCLTVVMWDFGGQDCFHVSHHLFWSSRALYLLVFDLRSFQLDSLNAWLKLLNLYAPDSCLLIVGTFREQFNGNLDEINSSLHELGSLPEGLITAGTSVVFAVDNKTMFGIEPLKRRMEEALEGLESVQIKIPLRWTRCLDRMVAASKDKGWIALDAVYPLARDLGVEGREVMDMLAAFHSFGAVVHFTSSTYLVDTVTTNPQWLVDAIASIIHNTSLHETDREALEKQQLLNDYERFVTSGLASRGLLEALWTSDNVDFLLELTQRLLLVSEWPSSLKNDEKVYLIPAMAGNQSKSKSESESESELELGSKRSLNGYMCVFDFTKTLLPPGLFARLVCCCVALTVTNAVTTTPVISQTSARFCLDGTGEIEVVVIHDEARLVVTIGNGSGAAKGLRILLAILRKIKEDFHLGTLEWETFVEEKKGEQRGQLLAYTEVVKLRKPPWFEDDEESRLDINLGLVF